MDYYHARLGAHTQRLRAVLEDSSASVAKLVATRLGPRLHRPTLARCHARWEAAGRRIETLLLRIGRSSRGAGTDEPVIVPGSRRAAAVNRGSV